MHRADALPEDKVAPSAEALLVAGRPRLEEALPGEGYPHPGAARPHPEAARLEARLEAARGAGLPGTGASVATAAREGGGW